MKQTDMILNHIRDYGSITPVEAMQEYGIMRLAARIADIRAKGINIKSEIMQAHNRFGDVVRYSRYSIAEEEENDGE